MAEDQQLSRLQNEFKRLRVDFERCCESESAKKTSDINENPSLESQQETFCSRSLEALKLCSVKCRSKHTKVVKRTSKQGRKQHCSPKVSLESNLLFRESHCGSQHLKEMHSQAGASEYYLQKNSLKSSGLVYPESEYGFCFTPESTADDTTVDELAGYFDTLVHIPRKMSEMAEMMYT